MTAYYTLTVLVFDTKKGGVSPAFFMVIPIAALISSLIRNGITAVW
jgi:hypothetical protein